MTPAFSVPENAGVFLTTRKGVVNWRTIRLVDW
jgi:hypothetical protein